MKLRTTLLLTCLMAVAFHVNGQRIARHTTDEGNVYPLLTMNSLLSMYSMAPVDWERNMKLISKVRDDYGKDGVTYTIENHDNTNDGWCFVTKKTDAVEIVYNIGPNNKSIFEDLMRDLKPYYVKDVDGHQVYSYKHLDEPEYIFLVKITAESEYVKVYMNE